MTIGERASAYVAADERAQGKDPSTWRSIKKGDRILIRRRKPVNKGKKRKSRSTNNPKPIGRIFHTLNLLLLSVVNFR